VKTLLAAKIGAAAVLGAVVAYVAMAEARPGPGPNDAGVTPLVHHAGGDPVDNSRPCNLAAGISERCVFFG
jgi:hypothetical protein